MPFIFITVEHYQILPHVNKKKTFLTITSMLPTIQDRAIFWALNMTGAREGFQSIR